MYVCACVCACVRAGNHQIQVWVARELSVEVPTTLCPIGLVCLCAQSEEIYETEDAEGAPADGELE